MGRLRVSGFGGRVNLDSRVRVRVGVRVRVRVRVRFRVQGFGFWVSCVGFRV